jgi:hypothetical protein
MALAGTDGEQGVSGGKAGRADGQDPDRVGAVAVPSGRDAD